ncbi:hypothetical protein HH310_19830 [Actinoplanes sp. TBRC 11911]|uniref:hypothetical protein n=1 Tax=Actinoplanes sp. TBRC 11911 TaxID=2729386 RepID=UPI00145DD167|nr:hypothetical protein [Actinoplanes sp. TBRC 11911]NMO53427.1 hypothetical protein [Actinoplanes sp. TBRC 11911]
MTGPTLPIDIDDLGIVGPRSLRAMQLIRIGRHPGTAVLIPARGIWVVSGRGPEAGSNGAGKTVLLGAISLHNGDPQWNGGQGTGPNAARLLFDHNRARVGDARFADAPHGYIAGVYLHDSAPDDAITVWMRIERHSSTHVQVRWRHGIHLVRGTTEEERFHQANNLWGDLRDNDSLSVTTYSAALFGKAPRCIAYIRARGSEENQDRGLLALGQRPFRPADLATQVITLSGKLQAVDNEREFRKDLDANETRLASKKETYRIQYQREEKELLEIKARNGARELLTQARESWETYLTLGAILAHERSEELTRNLTAIENKVEDKKLQIAEEEKKAAELPRSETLQAEIGKAKRAKSDAERSRDELLRQQGEAEGKRKTCEQQIANLRKTAAIAPGLDVPSAETQLIEAEQKYRVAQRRVEKLQESLDEATIRLQDLTSGRGGPAGGAIKALDAEGVTATAITDLISLIGDSRAQWEARLSPYAKAIVVAPKDHQRARSVLANHPGTPLLVHGDPQRPVAGSVTPQADENIVQFLEELERRMPPDGSTWVLDGSLKLEIPGGYEVPLTDRPAQIRALQRHIDDLKAERELVESLLPDEEQVHQAAKDSLDAAKAAAAIPAIETELENIRAHERQLLDAVEGAKNVADETGKKLHAAELKFKDLEKDRRELRIVIEKLKSSDEVGLGSLLQKAAATREQRRINKEVTETWKQASEIIDLGSAQAEIAGKGIILDDLTRDTCFREARTQLRRAIEKLIDKANREPDASTPGAANADEFHADLNANLYNLHAWCDDPRETSNSIRPFDAVAVPLLAWLTWHGAEDDTRKSQIDDKRQAEEGEIAAAEKQAAETRLWIQSQRENQIAIITRSFDNVEKKLNELLKSVNQDPIALRPKHIDLGDPGQPLRWELHPQWQPPGAKPVEYSNPPNTAELIILHTLLATASLVAATNPQGRMLVLDESGNNLDGPNLSRVASVLRQVAEKYGLTIVLACQDLYTDRVAHHAAAMIQLLRPSAQAPLNAPPAVSHGSENPAVLDALMPYLGLGRPDSDPADSAQPA